MTSSFPDQLLSLQHLISRLLPSSVDADAPAKTAATICRACQLSCHSLHPPEAAKDEIWNTLRSVSITPSSSQVDDVFRLVSQIHQRSLNNLKQTSLSYQEERLSQWNNDAAAFYEQMILTADVGSRVYDPRQSQLTPSSSSTAQISSHPTSNVASSSIPASASASISISTSIPSRKNRSGSDASWLRTRCAQLAVCQTGGATAHEMAISVLLLLCDKNLTDDLLQGDLFDHFAGDFDAVADVLQKRPAIVKNRDAVTTDCEQAREIFENGYSNFNLSMQSEQQQQQRSRRPNGRRGFGRQNQQQRNRNSRHQPSDFDEYEEDTLIESQKLGGSAYEERQKAFPGVQLENDSMIGNVERIGLPKGSTREVGKGYEEIFIPPPERKPTNQNELVDVATGLREHPELLEAMKGVKTLNRLQSAVYSTAFKSDENMLVCAPTGAGKTNVALLTIFREIVSVKLREKRNFKVVYVAPMKALAAEVTEKFTERLKPLGLTVREFTGDISPTRAETIATNVLVTTPEKWDVVTRKTGSEVGEALTLFIIDEIHLLHDERGAVLESIVARTLRFSETAQRRIRLVGLSATLPNYKDVGSFMKVNPNKGLFHFDGSHRPVPLSQTFIGISEGGTSNTNEARRRKENKVHEMAWKKVKDSLQRGHQAMIFVHSRKGTANAAREMINRATEDNIGDIFLGGRPKRENNLNMNDDLEIEDDESEAASIPSWAAKEISKSKTADIRELCMRGIGIHNAGLPRPDRKLVERLFADGVLKLLCCTATLAWGVNLPARSVIIMGTEVYNAEKGGFVQLGMLDVMQIFGRAGRPQFDTEGEGTIITDHEYLSKYLNLLTSSIPIESQLGSSASRLADHLNAEIVSGTVASIGDGVKWLSYTYLSIRMPKNPLVYGINWSDVEADSGLHSHRAGLIDLASKALDDARMCRYDRRTGMLSPLDLGRVSSYFYVSHETIVLWSEQFSNFTYGTPTTENDWRRIYSTVIHAVATSTEFEQMRSREDEGDELEYLLRHSCPIPLKNGYGSETREGKVSILLQSHISRANIKMSDLSYIVQSATRLLRALFEISLRRGMPSFSLAALELARASESKIWPFQHPLWQFTYLARRERGLLITPETIAAIESSGQETDLATLRTRSREELSELIRAPRIVATVEKVLKAIPTLEIVEAKVAPLSRTLLNIHVKLVVTFTWNDVLHGQLESWWLWIEDKEENRIYHSQKIRLTKRQVQELNNDVRENINAQTGHEPQQKTISVSITVAVFDPPSAQYWARIESDRWHTGGGSTALLSVASMQLPQELSYKTDVSNVTPSPLTPNLTGLQEKELKWFSNYLSHFSVAQTCILRTARFTNENVLACLPSGCGEISMMEMVMMNAYQKRPNGVVVVLCLQNGGLSKFDKCWSDRDGQSFCKTFGGGRGLLVMDEKNDRENLEEDLFHVNGGKELCKYSIVLSTPEFWSKFMQSVTRNVDDDNLFKYISTFIIADLHRLSDMPNIGIELLIARLRQYRRHQLEKSRLNQRMQGNEASGDKRNFNRGKVDLEEAIPRIVSFSGVVPNPLQLCEWMGASRKTGLFCFGDEARNVPIETYMVSVAGDRYSSRMQSINRPLYSTLQRHSHKKSAIIFVSSKRQTLLTAHDLLRLASLDNKQHIFAGTNKSKNNIKLDITKHLRTISDNGLKQVVPHGIGLYHENMANKERDSIEQLFENGNLLVLICTFGMISKLSSNIKGHSVIVKGTEKFDGKRRRYEDIHISDIRQMIGFAGIPSSSLSIDRSGIGYATVFVHEPKQTLFKKLVHEPLAVESGLGFDSNMYDLHNIVNDILLKQIVNGKLKLHVEVNGLDWMKNLLLFQRLVTNPGWYGQKKAPLKVIEKSGMDEVTFEKERKLGFCLDLLMNGLKNLEELGCISIQKSKASGTATGSEGGGRKGKKKKHIPSSATTSITNVTETDVGRLCVQCGLSSTSGWALREGIIKMNSDSKLIGFEQVMNCISVCEEIIERGKEYEDDSVWRILLEGVVKRYVEYEIYENTDVAARDMKLNGWIESSQKRGKLLAYNTLTGLVGGRHKDRENNLEISDLLKRIGNFIVDCALSMINDEENPITIQSLKEIVKVKQSIEMKCIWSDDFWNVCRLSTKRTTEKGRSEGWRTIQQVLKDEQQFSMFVARNCEESERGAIIRWLKAYPRLRVADITVKEGLVRVQVESNTDGSADKEPVVITVWDVEEGSKVIAGQKLLIGKGLTTVEMHIDGALKEQSSSTQKRKLGVWIAAERFIAADSCLATPNPVQNLEIS